MSTAILKLTLTLTLLEGDPRDAQDCPPYCTGRAVILTLNLTLNLTLTPIFQDPAEVKKSREAKEAAMQAKQKEMEKMSWNRKE